MSSADWIDGYEGKQNIALPKHNIVFLFEGHNAGFMQTSSIFALVQVYLALLIENFNIQCWRINI